MGFVKVVKVQNHTFSGVFVNMKITEFGKNVRNRLGREVVYVKIIPKEEPDDVLVPFFRLDGRLVGLLGIKAEAGAVVELVHHHLVNA